MDRSDSRQHTRQRDGGEHGRRATSTDPFYGDSEPDAQTSPQPLEGERETAVTHGSKVSGNRV
jgi:hypothetical protein